MSRRPLLLCGLALSVGLAATAWAQQDPPPPPQDPPPPSEEFAPPVESDEPIAEGEEGEGQPDLRRPLPPIPGRGEGDYGRPDPRRGPGPGGNRPGSRQYPDAPGAYSQPGAGGRAPGMPGRARIEQDPEMAALQEKDNQLERETMGIVEQFRRAEGEDQRAELREQITALAAEHFTVRQERRELEIKRLEAQLERLREALRKRSDDKDAVISRRVSQLTGEDDLGF